MGPKNEDMKVVILAGGFGTRMGEETVTKPKPMVEVGGKPILWHVMNHYASHGFKEFVIALGYRGEVIKDYLLNYVHYQNDFTINLKTGKTEFSTEHPVDWTVHLVDTGAATLTGGRLARLRKRLQGGTFMLTYGDGVSNVDLQRLLQFHRAHKKAATVTAVRPVSRFGNMELDNDEVAYFKEKPQGAEGWINGGFFVFEPRVFDYLDQGDETILEGGPMEALSRDRQLRAFRHEDFWHCMDTPRDRAFLEQLWASGNAPWAPQERPRAVRGR